MSDVSDFSANPIGISEMVSVLYTGIYSVLFCMLRTLGRVADKFCMSCLLTFSHLCILSGVVALPPIRIRPTACSLASPSAYALFLLQEWQRAVAAAAAGEQ